MFVVDPPDHHGIFRVIVVTSHRVRLWVHSNEGVNRGETLGADFHGCIVFTQSNSHSLVMLPYLSTVCACVCPLYLDGD